MKKKTKKKQLNWRENGVHLATHFVVLSEDQTDKWLDENEKQ